jgi:hypothetical protein
MRYDQLNASARAARSQNFAIAMVPHIEAAHKDGASTYRKMAGWLNVRRIKTLNGYTWEPKAIGELVRQIHGLNLDEPQMEPAE